MRFPARIHQETEGGLTGASVEVLVVDDDALADAGEAEAVSEALGAGLGIHVHGALGGRGNLRPDGSKQRQRQRASFQMHFHTQHERKQICMYHDDSTLKRGDWREQPRYGSQRARE